MGKCKPKLTHTDSAGRANMVDVGDKRPQRRRARAEGFIVLAKATRALIAENAVRKGDVLTVAQVAGIQAAKRTAELVPLCHTLTLEKVDVSLELTDTGVRAESLVRCTGKTGVEMEALTAVSAAMLCVYDMCKAVDKNMTIGPIRLIEKVKEDV
jgi:cyclic pyranopterin phosphate synthase